MIPVPARFFIRWRFRYTETIGGRVRKRWSQWSKIEDHATQALAERAWRARASEAKYRPTMTRELAIFHKGRRL